MVKRYDDEEGEGSTGDLMHLVPTPIPPDLEQAAADILEGVRDGHVIGLGIVVQLKGGRFFVDVFGRMVRDAHSARGWVRSLDDCLRDIGNERRTTR